MADAFPVICSSCKKKHDETSWKKLYKVGDQKVPAGDDPATEPAYILELRNCQCGSTIGFEKPGPNALQGVKPKDMGEAVDVVTEATGPNSAWAPDPRKRTRGQGRRMIADRLKRIRQKEQNRGHYLEVAETREIEPQPVVAKREPPDLDGFAGIDEEALAVKKVVLSMESGQSAWHILALAFKQGYYTTEEAHRVWWIEIDETIGDQVGFRAKARALELIVDEFELAMQKHLQGLMGLEGRDSPFTVREIEQWLRDAGFEVVRQKGSHKIWKPVGGGGHGVTVPGRSGEPVSKNVLKAVQKALEGKPPRGWSIEGIGDPQLTMDEHVDAAFVAAEDRDWARVELHLHFAVEHGYSADTANKLWAQLQQQYEEP